MMKIILLFLIILSSQCSVLKNNTFLKCEGLNVLDVKPYINQFSPCSHCDIPIDSLTNGITISLVDTSYEVIGLRVVYTNNENEVTVNDVTGYILDKKNYEILNKLEVGNFINIECINIKKDDELALSTSILVFVKN